MSRFQKALKVFCVGFVGILLVAMLGCAGMIDSIMPNYIERDAAAYANEPIKSFMPWTTIKDAERVLLKMNFMFETNQILYNRMKLDDKRLHQRLSEVQMRHIEDAKELRDAVFDPSAPGGLLLATLLGGTFGALAIPRPGDEKKKQVS